MDYRMISDYVTSFASEDNAYLKKLETNARERRIPIMQPESMVFVQHLIKWLKPRTILEIGTAVGFSAIKMALAGDQNSSIVSIEKDDVIGQEAVGNIKELALNDRIQVVHGEAGKILIEELPHNRYDLILIDAAKKQYQDFFERYSPLLSTDGVIISDNILFRGLVTQPKDVEDQQLKRLAEKIDGFNQWLAANKDFDTVFLTVGDGLSISSRKLTNRLR